jgi:aldehyde dehydrogenase (NAD+)
VWHERILLGKTFGMAKMADVGGSITLVRYYAGWADKVHGQTIEVCSEQMMISRIERPICCV